MNRAKIRPAMRHAVALLAFSVTPAFACTVSATSFSFGLIDPLVAVDTLSTSNISVACPSTTSYSVALSAGSGSYAERLMNNGSHTLSYNLYIDAAHTMIWGDGTGTSDVATGVADSSGVTHTVYGRVPHQPTAVPGSYSDSIVVTVTF